MMTPCAFFHRHETISIFFIYFMASCSIEDYKVVSKAEDKLSQIKEVSATELKEWIDKKVTSTGSAFFLIDTLPKESFNVEYIQFVTSSINIFLLPLMQTSIPQKRNS